MNERIGYAVCSIIAKGFVSGKDKLYNVEALIDIIIRKRLSGVCILG